MKQKILMLMIILQIINPVLYGISAQDFNQDQTDNVIQDNSKENIDNDINLDENNSNIEVEELTEENIVDNDVIENKENVEEDTDVEKTSIDNNEFELVEYTENEKNVFTNSNEEIQNNIQDELKKDSGKKVLRNKATGKSITSMESGTFMTIGGINKISYMYPTIEDAFNRSNGVSINGAGYDGVYFETTNYNEIDFVHIEISGFNGYMYLSDVQLIPNNLIKAKSHYILEGGKWTYKAAIDSLTSEEYINYNLGQAPSWAKEGVKYFSSNGETFSEKNGTSRSVLSASNYFQNLPIRSTTTYNAEIFKRFLISKGFGNSQYINSTNAFIEAEKLTGINGMFLFAFANHEGYYGTSTYSRRCNNFYGRGAYDSTPDNACIQFGFPQPRDGILAQGLFLQNMYANIDNWVYYGSHPGNKGSGMNVKYATDPNWGIKIANIMNEIDVFGGRTDLNRFRIAQVNANNLPVFYSPNLNDHVKLYDYSNYYLFNNTCRVNSNSCNRNSKINVIITNENSGYYEVQLDTPMNKGAAGNYYYKKAEKGSWPNYNNNQNSGKYVGHNQVIPYVDYGSFEGQQAWTPKNFHGTNSLNMLNNAPIVSPGNGVLPESWEEYWIGNNVKHIKYYRYGVLINHHIFVYENNKLKTQEIYTYLLDGQIDYKNYLTYDQNETERSNKKVDYSNGNIIKTEEYFYDSIGKKLRFEMLEYNNGSLLSTTVLNYNSLENVYQKLYKPMLNGEVDYDEYTYYDSNGQYKKIEKFDYEGKFLVEKTTIYFTNGKKIRDEILEFSQANLISTTILNYNSDEKLIQKLYKPMLNGEVDYDEYTYYDSNGNIFEIEKFDYQGKYLIEQIKNEYSNGILVRETRLFYNNGKKIRDEILEFSQGRLLSTTILNYNSNEKLVQKLYKPMLNGEVDYDEYTYYDSNGNIFETEKFDYQGKYLIEQIKNEYSNGILVKETRLFYNNGKKIRDEILEFSEGKLLSTTVLNYNSNEKLIQKLYKPMLNGEVDYDEYTYYDTNGNIFKTEKFDYQGKYLIEQIKNEYSNGILVRETRLFYNNGKKIRDEILEFSQGRLLSTTILNYNSDEKLIQKLYKPMLNGEVDYDEYTYYDTNGNIFETEKFDYQGKYLIEQIKNEYSNGILVRETRFFYNNGKKIRDEILEFSEGKLLSTTVLNYNSNEKLIQKLYKPMINGEVDYDEYSYYDSNNELIRTEKFDYQGKYLIQKVTTYYENGKVIDKEVINYR